MPNLIWNRIAGGSGPVPKKGKRIYPYTAAFCKDNFCIGIARGIKTFSDFPAADFLNIIYRNGKTKIVRKYF